MRRMPKVRWAAAVAEPLGVMVGVTKGQEGLLPWWWWAYARRNALPVAFVDYGMNDKARAWCAEHGRLVAHGAPEGVRGWFRKPFGFLQSPFGKTLWTDLDVEVRGDVAQFLADRWSGAAVAMAEDWSYPARLQHKLPKGCLCYSSAVTAFAHGDPFISTWAEHTWLEEYDTRGDQEVASILVHRTACRVETLPVELVRSRQEGEAEGLLAVHWSGPGGKAGIRRAWAAIRERQAESMADVYSCPWLHPTPEGNEGVVVAVDAEQEWLLDWWYANLRRYTDLPVWFVDLGMSADARAWCAARGGVSPPVTRGDEHGMYGWFKKPLALLTTPFRRSIWFDADVEIRGDVRRLLDECPAGKMGMTFDRGTPDDYRDAMPTDGPIHNSGVIVYDHGDRVLPEWASMTLAIHSDKPGDPSGGQPGDQETLALTLRATAPEHVHRFSEDLVRLRFDEDGPFLVKHWTGPVGKKRIRKMIASSEDGTPAEVLLLGSGPGVDEWWGRHQAHFRNHRIAAINNAWAVAGRLDYWFRSSDFLEHVSVRGWGDKEVEAWTRADELAPGREPHWYECPGSGTMFLNAVYTLLNWAVRHRRQLTLTVAGCDHVYPKDGDTHFYGKSTDDPMRFGDEWLDQQFRRVRELYETEGMVLRNGSDQQETRLPFDRAEALVTA